MIEFQNTNRHFVTTNSEGFITDGFSQIFRQPTSADICIQEAAPTHFEIDGVTNPPLYNIDRLPIYRLDKDNHPVKITEVELKASNTFAKHTRQKQIDTLSNFLKESDGKMVRVTEEMVDGEVSAYGRELITARKNARLEISRLYKEMQ